MRKKSYKAKHGLVVTQEAIRRFSKLSTAKRVQWLEETREFLAAAKVSISQRQAAF